MHKRRSSCILLSVAAMSMLATACTAGGNDTADSEPAPQATQTYSSAGATGATPQPVPTVAVGELREFPPAPAVLTGPLSPAVTDAFGAILGADPSTEDFDTLGQSGDARVAWILADLMRFIRSPGALDTVRLAYQNVTGTEIDVFSAWGDATDQLIAWDLPAPPDYATWKSRIFETIEPGWADFFADEDAEIDWRHVSWGGVLMDARPLDAVNRPCERGCIPAIDDPVVTNAAGGTWYPDDAIVFGLEVNGETRAYPKNLMEVHEMANDNLGGRRIGMPYCTLCGSAQAYFIDDPDAIAAAEAVGATLPDGVLELRTSGLLIRSNKVMYEFYTRSVFDTFTGEAVTGPLREAGVQLEPVTVVTTTWGDWKATHPETTILIETRPWGGTYPLDPLGGRDDNGPIFPIGDVDARLSEQTPVLGVFAPDGTPLAFPVDAARSVLVSQQPVEQSGVRVRLDGLGLRAELLDGTPLPSHQAFWFAWSQFHPETELWLPGTDG